MDEVSKSAGGQNTVKLQDVIIERYMADKPTLFKDSNIKLVVYPDFKTATVVLKSGQRIDLSSARKEYYVKNGALPTVSQGGIKEDLFRRDFTINAMALKCMDSDKAELIDLFQGYEDIKKKNIRILYEKSFLDDPTRIFRAIRYEQRLGFNLERKTSNLLKSAVNHNVLNEISKERYFNELKKILCEVSVEDMIARLDHFGIFVYLDKEVKVNYKMLHALQKNQGEFKDLEVPIWFIYFMSMLEGSGVKIIDRIIERFSFDKQQKKSLLQLSKVPIILKELQQGSKKFSDIFYVLNDVTEEIFDYLWLRSANKEVRKRLKQFLSGRQVRLTIGGEDLKKLGVKSGRRMGDLMKLILLEKVNRGIKTHKEELELAKVLIESN